MINLINETDFFVLYAIYDGIYAAIAKPGQGAWSNAGIVDLGNELLVFDSFTTPSAGYELRRQAESITGKKVKYLINSHFHGDHFFGNQAFRDSTIISTSLTKTWCKQRNKIDDLDKEKEEMRQYLNDLESQIEENQNPIIKDSLTLTYNEMSKVLEDLPKLELVLPTVIFEEKLVIEGSKRKIELYCHGGGHTPSDTFMYLPDEKIAFMGDILTEGLHLPIYNPEEFSSILTNVKEMDIETIIPGHGNIGSNELLNTMADYISFLIEKSKKALINKQSLESFVNELVTPTLYKNWIGAKGIKDNLSKVYTFYKKYEN